jgi:hypothetical protein
VVNTGLRKSGKPLPRWLWTIAWVLLTLIIVGQIASQVAYRLGRAEALKIREADTQWSLGQKKIATNLLGDLNGLSRDELEKRLLEKIGPNRPRPMQTGTMSGFVAPVPPGLGRGASYPLPPPPPPSIVWSDPVRNWELRIDMYPNSNELSLTPLKLSRLPKLPPQWSQLQGRFVYMMVPYALLLGIAISALVLNRSALAFADGALICAVLSGVGLFDFPSSIDPREWNLDRSNMVAVWLFGFFAAWIVHKIAVRQRLECDDSCPACGYDLTGNVSGICPECGTAISKEHSELLAAKA